MKQLTGRREGGGPPAAVRRAIEDTGPFSRAGGFHPIALDGDGLPLTNQVGLPTIELTLEVFDAPDVVFADRQVEGIFEEMETRFSLAETPEGVDVTGRTSFALDRALISPLLAATVIKRQRQWELDGQFDYREARSRANPAGS